MEKWVNYMLPFHFPYWVKDKEFYLADCFPIFKSFSLITVISGKYILTKTLCLVGSVSGKDFCPMLQNSSIFVFEYELNMDI